MEPDGQRADGASRGALAAARDELLRAHYDEFRKVAGRVLNGDAAALQIQPTDLAHEAVIRLSGLDRLDFKGRTHLVSPAMAAAAAIAGHFVDIREWR